MSRIEIQTISMARQAVKVARAVYILPRFGVSERWVKITKAEALELLADFNASDTPAEVEMFAGTFGTLKGSILYLG